MFLFVHELLCKLCAILLFLPVLVAGAGAGDGDPKNQNYIAIPFICHLREHSVTTHS